MTTTKQKITKILNNLEMIENIARTQQGRIKNNYSKRNILILREALICILNHAVKVSNLT